jgi:hypothetical protein
VLPYTIVAGGPVTCPDAREDLGVLYLAAHKT